MAFHSQSTVIKAKNSFMHLNKWCAANLLLIYILKGKAKYTSLITAFEEKTVETSHRNVAQFAVICDDIVA